jgi:glyoxylase-like metal-dependent hydrolase (beta-lactamase superfamily II)
MTTLDATPLEWRIYEAGFCTHPEAATRRGAPMRVCQYPALVSVLRHPREGVILFDTGYSGHFLGATAKLPERLYRVVTPVHLGAGGSLRAQLERDGVPAGSVDWIVVSHLHGDHVGAVADFPRARIACSREAWRDMQGRTRIGALAKGLLPALVDARAQQRMQWIEEFARVPLAGAMARFGEAFDLFGDGSVRLVSLPGHAAGHYGLLFCDARGQVLLVADASWSSRAIREMTPPPALVTGWLGDTAMYRDTLSKLRALQLEQPELRLVPSHCPEWRPATQEQAHA